MAGVTRRGFITTSGAAAAGLATAGVTGGALSAVLGAGTAEQLAAATAAATSEGMVAYVRTGSKGQVTVIAGNREVSYHDPQLVRRMQKALG